MPTRRAQSHPAGLSDARAFLDKAREFLRAAQDSLELANNTAAVGNAVHAGILAADAISAVRTRTVWRGEHAQAAGQLETAGEDGKLAARQLRRLLPMKTRAEYEPTPIRPTDARAAVHAADRLVALATTALSVAPPGTESGSK